MDSRLRLFGSCALLGTTRRSPSFSEADFPAGSLLGDIVIGSEASPESSARALLCGAGSLFVCGRAGYQPSSCDESLSVPDPCAEEKRDMLPEDSPVTDVYGEIFRSGQMRLQWEALSYLEKRYMVLPHSLLVPALMTGRSNPVLRPLLARTVGERGLWLASQNPDWRMFAASSGSEPDVEAWEHGRPMQRQAYFLAVRRTDPARARELFEKDMSSMDASERNTLLGLFEHGLSLEDEDLLERLLGKDRSREVKKTASSLLSRLPGSRYVERMGGRLCACMKEFLSAPEPSILSGLRRVAAAVTGRAAAESSFIVPPEAYDAAWAQDLISEKSPFSGLGPRAGWLYQMAVAVPLSWWTKRTGKSPEELLTLSDRSEWKDALRQAWGDAICREPDGAWARAMLAFLKKGGTWPASPGQQLDVFRLVDMLPQNERDDAWEELLTARNLPNLLHDMHHRQEEGYVMSRTLAKKALSAAKQRLAARNWDYSLSAVAGELAVLLPPDMLAEAREFLAFPPDSDSPNRNIVGTFSAVAIQREALGAYFS